MNSKNQRERHLAAAALLPLALAHTACADDCPHDEAPGLCARDGFYVALGQPLADGTLVDVDGDGVREFVGVSERYGADSLVVAWEDGRRVQRRLPARVSAIVAIRENPTPARPRVATLAHHDERLDIHALDPEGAPVETRSIAIGGELQGLWALDLDGDGREALVTTDRLRGALAIVDSATEALTWVELGFAPTSVAAGDVDGDGALDLVVADFLRAEVAALRGDDAGGFAPAERFASVLGVDELALGDVDGDGSLDLVARGGIAEVWVHLGDGAGGFGAPVVLASVEERAEPRGLGVVPAGATGFGGVLLPEASGLSTWLLDPGGDVLGRARRRATLGLRGVDDGRWLALDSGATALEITEQPLPVEVWRRHASDPQRERWGAVTTADWDGDGHVDLIAARSLQGEMTTDEGDSSTAADDPDEAWERRAVIFLGAGDGSFVGGGDLPIGGASALLVGDFDGDGQSDVLSGTGPSAQWLTTSAHGESAPIADLASGEREWSNVAVVPSSPRDRLAAEVSSPGGSAPELRLLSLDAGGVVDREITLASDVKVIDLRVADLDADGDADLLLFGEEDGQRVLQTWRFDGDEAHPGVRHPLAALAGIAADTQVTGLGVADLDDDGLTEVLLTTTDSLTRIASVDAPAPVVEVVAIELAPSIMVSALSREFVIPPLTVADFDGDGAPDVLRCSGDCDVLRGAEDGAFAPAAAVPLPFTLASLDIDGDSRPDFVVGDPTEVGVMLTGTYPGPKVVAEYPRFSLPDAPLLAADLDGDGTRELVVTEPSGVGALWSAAQDDERVDVASVEALRAATVADLDRDGEDELVISHGLGERSLSALRWDGARLRLDPLSAPFQPATDRIEVHDLDGDDVDDLVLRDRETLWIAYGLDAAVFAEPEPLHPATTEKLVVGDLNADDRPELLLVGDGEATILWGRANRRWGRATIAADDAAIRGGELVVRRGAELLLLRASGEHLAPPLRLVEDPRLAETVDLIGGPDLDGDGAEDLVSALPYSTQLVWLTRSAGLYRPIEVYASAYATFADIDGGGVDDTIDVFTDIGIWVTWGEPR